MQKRSANPSLSVSAGGRGGGRPPSGSASSKLPDYLTLEEAETFVRAIDFGRHRERDVALVLLLWGTGARVSEVLSATLHDLRTQVDASGAGVLKVSGKGRRRKDGTLVKRERELAIPPRAMRSLVKYLQPRGWPFNCGPDPLFVSGRGCALSRNRVWEIFRVGAERSGLRDRKPDGRFRIHPHTLRHTCATQMLEAGRDIRNIQEYLGHASISSTERYTHVDLSRKLLEAGRHPMEG